MVSIVIMVCTVEPPWYHFDNGMYCRTPMVINCDNGMYCRTPMVSIVIVVCTVEPPWYQL